MPNQLWPMHGKQSCVLSLSLTPGRFFALVVVHRRVVGGVYVLHVAVALSYLTRDY